MVLLIERLWKSVISKLPIVRLVLLCLSVLGSLYLGFMRFDGAGAMRVIGEWGYWLVLLSFGLLVFHVCCALRGFQTVAPDAGSWYRFVALRFRAQVFSALVIFLLSIVVFFSQPKGFKIVMDEPILGLTALQMHREKEAFFAGRSYEIGGVLHLNGRLVDKRPLFFPFLTSLLHDLTGYRPYQTVALNALLVPVSLFLLYLLGQRLYPPLGGYLAVCLMATVPLLPMVGSSGGFDLLNLVMILLLGFAADAYVKRPVPVRLNILVLLAVLLAQTRYESVLFIFPVALLILWTWWKARAVQITWTLILVPCLLLNYALQRSMVNEYDAFWDMKEGSVVPFSLSYVANNLEHAGRYFFASGRELPNSWFLSCLFIVALLFLVLALLRQRLRLSELSSSMVVGLMFSGVILVNFGLLMCYNWGQLDDIAATRLVFPFLLLQVCVVVFFLSHLSRRVGTLMLCLTVIFYFSVTRPTCAQTDFLDWTIKKDHCEQLIEWTGTYGEGNPLFISNVGFCAALGLKSFLAMEPALAQLPQLELHMRLRSFSEIYVLYLLPTPRVELSEHPLLQRSSKEKDLIFKAFDLQTIEEVKLNDAAYLRLARVQAVRLDGVSPLQLDATGLSISHTGKMSFENPDVLGAFINSLPR